MKTGTCIHCKAVKSLSELNGTNPITGDNKDAYCKRLDDCHSENTDRIVSELMLHLTNKGNSSDDKRV